MDWLDIRLQTEGRISIKEHECLLLPDIWGVQWLWRLTRRSVQEKLWGADCAFWTGAATIIWEAASKENEFKEVTDGGKVDR